jgi:predicted DNA-binding antitoxin AbrB/MazE fold protein
MLKTIKARYERGQIQPLEPLPVADGAEIEVTITLPETPAQSDATDPTAATAGAWENLLDCDQFEDDLYQNRSLRTRPDVAF